MCKICVSVGSDDFQVIIWELERNWQKIDFRNLQARGGVVVHQQPDREPETHRTQDSRHPTGKTTNLPHE
jgi:hypothetical protein